MQPSHKFVSFLYGIKITQNLISYVYNLLRFFNVRHATYPTLIGVALYRYSPQTKEPLVSDE